MTCLKLTRELRDLSDTLRVQISVQPPVAPAELIDEGDATKVEEAARALVDGAYV